MLFLLKALLKWEAAVESPTHALSVTCPGPRGPELSVTCLLGSDQSREVLFADLLWGAGFSWCPRLRWLTGWPRRPLGSRGV